MCCAAGRCKVCTQIAGTSTHQCQYTRITISCRAYCKMVCIHGLHTAAFAERRRPEFHGCWPTDMRRTHAADPVAQAARP